MITLTNNYHGTSINLRPKKHELYELYELSKHQMNRARKELCTSGGFPHCRCGGIRGPQYDNNGGKIILIEDLEGNASIELFGENTVLDYLDNLPAR